MSNNSSNTTAVLAAENVTKVVSSAEASLTILSDISFSVEKGESIAIVGPSGAGKSTLLALLAGLDLPTSGKIRLDSHCLTDLDEDGRAAARARSVGFVFQSFHLVPSLNALENVMLPLELAGKPTPRESAMTILAEVGLGDRWSHYPAQLSGGEKQRVAIARAFATEPAVLFADEPTGNLDARTGQNIMNIMFELNKNISTTLVLVTHDKTLAARCDREIGIVVGKLITDSRAAA
jgi:putative ABC transport system ATP-binding protein